MIQTWWIILQNKLDNWWLRFITSLPNILLALIIIVVFVFVAKWVRKLAYKLTIRMSGKDSVSGLFSTMAYVIILFIGLFFALDILGLDKTVSSLLAGAGILGLVLGFAFQDLSSNFVSGFFIALRKPFEVGQTVETNGYMGNIEDIQLRSTTMRTFQGLHVMIPNKDIFQKPMINYSRTQERRIELSVNISSDSDLRLAEKSVFEAMSTITYLHKERKPEVYFTDFKEASIVMAVWFWIYNHEPPGFMVARHDAIIQITDSLHNAGILIVAPVTVKQLAATSAH
ncbi:MAG: mechanosensitive ion channel [Chitinophagaceae bacterium]|nr:mechanosensitive ion channel [Chitinophagaceae bacterium]